MAACVMHAVNPNPTDEHRKVLADRIGLSEREVQVRVRVCGTCVHVLHSAAQSSSCNHPHCGKLHSPTCPHQ